MISTTDGLPTLVTNEFAAEYWIHSRPVYVQDLHSLTYLGRGKMATIFKTTYSNAFSGPKFFEFRLIFPCFFPYSLIDYNSAVVQIIAWRWAGDKQLSEPMMTYFTDAYMRLSASMIC